MILIKYYTAQVLGQPRSPKKSLRFKKNPKESKIFKNNQNNSKNPKESKSIQKNPKESKRNQSIQKNPKETKVSKRFQIMKRFQKRKSHETNQVAARTHRYSIRIQKILIESKKF